LLELSSAASDCEHVRQRAEAKIADIEGKIRSLQQMRRSLGRIVDRCRAKDSTEDCPLVHTAGRKPKQFACRERGLDAEAVLARLLRCVGGEK
jgi:MerR family mercuric resistance operon transcriptional regulator